MLRSNHPTMQEGPVPRPLPPQEYATDDRGVGMGGTQREQTRAAGKAQLPEEDLVYFESMLGVGREWAAKQLFAAAAHQFERAGRLASQLAGRARGTAAQRLAQPYIELARVSIAMQDADGAIAAAEAAVEMAPKSSLAWNTKGRAQLYGKNYKQATDAFKRAVELNENNVWAKNNLGYAALLQGDFATAVVHLTEATDQATKQKTATGYMFNNLGLALEHRPQEADYLDRARAAFKRGAELGSVAAAASYERLKDVKPIAPKAAPAEQPVQAGAVPIVEPEGDKRLDEAASNSQDHRDGHATASVPMQTSTFDLAFKCESPNGEFALQRADAAQATWAEKTRGNSTDILSILRHNWRNPK
jgi:tetratricopeptide (TPR) repeat protein